MQTFSGINNCKRETELVVSLTSEEHNFKILPITLSSLLNQKLKPDRIILWLDQDGYDLTTLPYEITKFIKNGLEIRFIKDLGEYNKTIYPIKEFQKSIVVTAKENVYYPSDWLKKLYISYIASPEDIHVHKTIHKSEEKSDFEYIPNSLGGILYPPNCFTKEALREDIFLQNAPESDNVWFWLIAVLNGRKIRVVKNHIKFFLNTNFRHKTNYNKAIENLMKFYGENIKLRISKNKSTL